MTKLALYLLLAFVTLGLLAAALGFLAQTSAAVARKLLDTIGYFAGKAGNGCRVTVPQKLNEARNNPNLDKDFIAQRNYQPSYVPASFPIISMPTEESERTSHFLESPTVLIEKANLLSHPSETVSFDFLSALETARVPQSYFRVPLKPEAPLPPPVWTPWVIVDEDASIELPRYKGIFSFLNDLVSKCYETELSHFKKIQTEIEELRLKATKRNNELERLSSLNKTRYEECIKELDSRWDLEVKNHQNALDKFSLELERNRLFAEQLRSEISKPGKDGLLARTNSALEKSKLPEFISNEGTSSFDESSGIFIHEHRFPVLSSIEWLKLTEPRSQLDKLKKIKLKKPASIKEKKEAAAKVYPSLSIRLCKDILSQDRQGLIKAIAINGWCEYIEKSTGQTKKAYCSSLFATRDQIEELNTHSVDPVEAFIRLKGVTAKTIEVTPIAPIVKLDTNDPRFVDSREILSNLQAGQNLAAMDWEDFEHLCRELFERAFAGSGAEVKVTQASRDQGVDAIVFDPDPIRGGKIIIQAKRYTNTVDVSAVRDLYGALINEGATKGILVTTSQYGPESYSFAKDKPITLLNGQELLGLLEKFDYNNFTINLEDAKKALRQ